jgi:hypothetical protein
VGTESRFRISLVVAAGVEDARVEQHRDDPGRSHVGGRR